MNDKPTDEEKIEKKRKALEKARATRAANLQKKRDEEIIQEFKDRREKFAKLKRDEVTEYKRYKVLQAKAEKSGKDEDWDKLFEQQNICTYIIGTIVEMKKLGVEDESADA